MTIEQQQLNEQGCPAEEVLKLLAGKWKPQILRLAMDDVLRFNSLLKQLPGSSKQAVSQALKDLETAGVLEKNVIKLKPLHIEYSLTEKGRGMIPLIRGMEGFMTPSCAK